MLEILHTEMPSIFTLPLAQVFLLFIIFSFVGWISEVFYVGVFHEHKFVNRGMLHGPICPVYGFGGLVVFCQPLFILDSWIFSFIGSMILCSAVEYLASYVLEKTLHTTWWDYSHYKFHLNGRICLLNSTLFGLMGMAGAKILRPILYWLLCLLNQRQTELVSVGLALVLLIDLITTINRLVNFRTVMARIKDFGEELKVRFAEETWFNGESFETMFASVRLHAEETKDKVSVALVEKMDHLAEHRQKYINTFIAKFPTMKSKLHSDSLEYAKLKFKVAVAEKKSRIKEKLAR